MIYMTEPKQKRKQHCMIANCDERKMYSFYDIWMAKQLQNTDDTYMTFRLQNEQMLFGFKSSRMCFHIVP